MATSTVTISFPQHGDIMAIKAEDIPKLLGLLVLLGGSMYVTFWLAGKIRNEIEEILT